MGQGKSPYRICVALLVAILVGATPLYVSEMTSGLGGAGASQVGTPIGTSAPANPIFGTGSPATSVYPSPSTSGVLPGDDDNQTTHSQSTSTSSSSRSHSYSNESETSTTASQHSQSQTSSTKTGQPDSGEDSGANLQLQFTMASAQGQGAGTGKGGIGLGEEGLYVVVELDQMAPNSRFSLALVVNGSSRLVGNFSTDQDGQAQIQAGYSLQHGTFSLGLAVYGSNSGRLGPLVMTSTPASLPLTIGAPSTHSSTQSSTQHTQSVNILPGDNGEEDNIHNAIQTKVIPAVIHVGSTGVDYTVLDPGFTLFVGELQTGGLQITISAVNGTTPRVLLVNLTSPQQVNLQPGALAITFDGSPVQQAASVSQVISPQPGSGPLFVLVSTSTGYQLLILIPHFSSHLIQILPAIASAIISFWTLDGATLILSIAVVSSLFLLVYSRRTHLHR